MANAHVCVIWIFHCSKEKKQGGGGGGKGKWSDVDDGTTPLDEEEA